MSDVHAGGCHCGQLRYECDAPLTDVAHCHCSVCRRTTGGIVTTWVTVPIGSFRWTQGKPAEYRSSATCLRYFCGSCGAQLALFTDHAPETLDLTTATLDEVATVVPDRHIWVKSRLPWIHLDEQLEEEWEEKL
ncbi:GFA family protein [Pseudomonas sp. PDM18]|uniref:GFA family protein n=1 Tax=Pseudomonas sp. PDM18 TaxID=2769253 RepID=UPI00178334D7|nr:GFA family protein [Pseudomonas sp. PDM18]MBD9677765.1 GFA family protein [Pseudomonas sp. PDM18]